MKFARGEGRTSATRVRGASPCSRERSAPAVGSPEGVERRAPDHCTTLIGGITLDADATSAAIAQDPLRFGASPNGRWPTVGTFDRQVVRHAFPCLISHGPDLSLRWGLERAPFAGLVRFILSFDALASQ